MNNEEKVLINLRMKRSLVEEVKAIADRMEIPYSQFIRMAIKQAIETTNKEKQNESVNG